MANLVYIDYTEIICTVTGGIIKSITWTKNGLNALDQSFMQALPQISKVSATTTFIISTENPSNYLGSLQCSVTDGNGRRASRTVQINCKHCLLNL